MRYPSGDTADQPGRRRRGHRADQPAGSQHPARQQSDEASVFVPGYAGGREAGESASGGSAAASPSWHGSSAGKGPVRGYPPLPGQPLPMYPPGQFAAWNRRAPGRARHASEAAAGGGSGDGSGYYAAESEPHTDPGYSMLAVSDPAADVTSTQTWQAVGDGRATGIWTAPARPGSDPAAPSRATGTPAIPEPRSGPDPDRADASPGRRGSADLADGAGQPRDTAGRPIVTAGRSSGTAGLRGDTAGPAGVLAGSAGQGASDPGRRGTRGHSGVHTGPRRADQSDAPRRLGGTKRRRKHPANVKLAMVTALVLVLAAAAALSYAVFRGSGTP